MKHSFEHTLLTVRLAVSARPGRFLPARVGQRPLARDGAHSDKGTEKGRRRKRGTRGTESASRAKVACAGMTGRPILTARADGGARGRGVSLGFATEFAERWPSTFKHCESSSTRDYASELPAVHCTVIDLATAYA
jgi:hypothetical protein